MADAVARVHQIDANHRADPDKLGLRWYQIHSEAAQGAVAHVHAHDGAAGQQKGQQVPQVELVIDGRHQKHQNRRRQREAGACGQDVDIALVQSGGVAQGCARLPPVSKAASHEAHGMQKGIHPACSRSANRGRRRARGGRRRTGFAGLLAAPPWGGGAEGASGGCHHGSATASSMARTCSTEPRPASPTGMSRCAMVCGRTVCTSSGAT